MRRELLRGTQFRLLVDNNNPSSLLPHLLKLALLLPPPLRSLPSLAQHLLRRVNLRLPLSPSTPLLPIPSSSPPQLHLLPPPTSQAKTSSNNSNPNQFAQAQQQEDSPLPLPLSPPADSSTHAHQTSKNEIEEPQLERLEDPTTTATTTILLPSPRIDRIWIRRVLCWNRRQEESSPLFRG